MGTEYWWIYDIMAVAIVVGCIIVSWKRGLLKTLVLIVGYAFACVGGYFVANQYADNVYDRFLKEKCESIVEDNIVDFNANDEINEVLAEQNIPIELTDEQIDEIINYDGTVSEGVINYLEERQIPLTQDMKQKITQELSSDSIVSKLEGKINDRAYNILVEYNKIADNAIDKIFKSMVQSNETSIAEELNNIVIKPIIIKVLKVVIFILVFLVIIIIVKIVANLMKFVNTIPIAGGINRLLGGGLGFLQGILILYVVSLLIKIIIAVTSNQITILNDETINASKIFKGIYNYNLFR